MTTKPDLKDYHYDQAIVTFAGVYMGQDWLDLELWERFCNRHAVKCIIELGTSNGGLSLFLAMQALRLGAQFHTFDNQAFIDLNAPLARALPLQFHHADVWGAGHALIAKLLAQPALHPLVLFCDDGDKPREWRTFGPLLSTGDYIAVHDYSTEFMPADEGDLPVERVMVDLCTARGSITRWYRVSGRGGPVTT